MDREKERQVVRQTDDRQEDRKKSVLRRRQYEIVMKFEAASLSLATRLSEKQAGFGRKLCEMLYLFLFSTFFFILQNLQDCSKNFVSTYICYCKRYIDYAMMKGSEWESKREREGEREREREKQRNREKVQGRSGKRELQ